MEDPPATTSRGSRLTKRLSKLAPPKPWTCCLPQSKTAEKYQNLVIAVNVFSKDFRSGKYAEVRPTTRGGSLGGGW